MRCANTDLFAMRSCRSLLLMRFMCMLVVRPDCRSSRNWHSSSVSISPSPLLSNTGGPGQNTSRELQSDTKLHMANSSPPYWARDNQAAHSHSAVGVSLTWPDEIDLCGGDGDASSQAAVKKLLLVEFPIVV